jgi:hypothetical protein
MILHVQADECYKEPEVRACAPRIWAIDMLDMLARTSATLLLINSTDRQTDRQPDTDRSGLVYLSALA